MLPDEEVTKLIIKAQSGDKPSKEALLENNLNLVRSVIQRFTNRGYEWDDLFQIGCIGLIKSIEKFDVSFEVKFSTYAVPMIIGEIRRFIRDDNPVKVSRPMKELAYRIYREQEQLNNALGREPTIIEISQELSITPQEIVAALDANKTPLSLYEPSAHGEEDSIPLLDKICCNDESESNLDNLALKEALAKLPYKERTVIFMRFFQDRTQSEIAEFIGVSQVQVSRIEKNAIKFIRQHFVLETG